MILSTSRLPEGADYQYRIKSPNEPHERIGQGKPVKARCITAVVLNWSSARLKRERS
jgi:hypothetical protein